MNSNLLGKAVEENLNDHVDGVRWEKESERGGEESAHACTEGGEISCCQNLTPFRNRGLDVHVQEGVGPLCSRFFSEINFILTVRLLLHNAFVG